MRLWREVERHPPPGVDRLHRWRSPLRGLWLTSMLGSVLLATLPVVILTGLISYIVYAPQFGTALPVQVGWLKSTAPTCHSKWVKSIDFQAS